MLGSGTHAGIQRSIIPHTALALIFAVYLSTSQQYQEFSVTLLYLCRMDKWHSKCENAMWSIVLLFLSSFSHQTCPRNTDKMRNFWGPAGAAGLVQKLQTVQGKLKEIIQRRQSVQLLVWKQPCCIELRLVDKIDIQTGLRFCLMNDGEMIGNSWWL